MALRQRQCGWCSTATTELARTNCASCGGPLPPLPLAVLRLHPELGVSDEALLAVKPGPAPRKLPRGYRARVTFWKNPLAVIGAAFGAFGVLFGGLGCPLTIVLIPLGLGFLGFGVLFGGLGALMAFFGVRAGAVRIRALVDGVPARGRIVEVHTDTSQSINGRHPRSIRYVFDAGDGVHEGVATAWEWLDGDRDPDEPCWVVYLPDDPDTNALWPPVR